MLLLQVFCLYLLGRSSASPSYTIGFESNVYICGQQKATPNLDFFLSHKFNIVDIASVSLEQCEKRYNEMKAREDRRRPIFSAEFIVADATKVFSFKAFRSF